MANILREVFGQFWKTYKDMGDGTHAEVIDAGLIDPGEVFVDITPSDANDLAAITRGIYVGTGGDLAVHDTEGTAVTFVGLAAGMVHPLRVRRVLNTGTTADDIVGIY